MNANYTQTQLLPLLARRRRLIQGGAALWLTAGVARFTFATDHDNSGAHTIEATVAGTGTGIAATRDNPDGPVRVRPLPLGQVRLTASPWLDAVHANRKFLLALDPDRLLSRFRSNAGLPPRAQPYGGWESDTIAGHTLGHYLSAVSLMHAQLGDAECGRRANAIVAELALCQQQGTDGYVAALGRRVDGKIQRNGKSLFDDVMAGKIDPRFGNLNGGWAPLYILHKQLAGLLDAHEHVGNTQALQVAVGLAGYIDHVFAALDEQQTQLVLDCEYGGLQESMATLYERTGERRWLLLARRLRHEKTFRPLAQALDQLDKAHSNTEIPKYVGAARLYEIDGGADNAAATEFFWRTVTAYRTYANGGNGDREWFYPRGRISRHITDQTCEHCSTYNMLKISRHLFQWQPRADWFDYFERAHLNHTLAAQDPHTGMFAYMMPMMAGARRTWSRPDDQFWCCMGSGMEAHAKHGESIYWTDANNDTLYVNEYIPSVATWPGVGVFALQTRFPHAETVTLLAQTDTAPVTVKLRVPGWAGTPLLRINGTVAACRVEDGYLCVTRPFVRGDRVQLRLPMRISVEAAPDDAALRTFFHGPLLLGADLGTDGAALPPDLTPALLQASAAPVASGRDTWRLRTAAGDPLTLRPFYGLWSRRAAVYFPVYTPAGWSAEARRRATVAADRKRVATQSLDRFRPGDAASEAAHGYRDDRTEITPYRGLTGRLIKAGGGFIEADLRAGTGPMTLYVTYWGEAERGLLDIRIDGVLIATQALERPRENDFFEAVYPIAAAPSGQRDRVRVRLEPRHDTRGPSIYGVRTMAVAGT